MPTMIEQKTPVPRVRAQKSKTGWYARWLAALGLNSLLLSILGHILFAVVAAYLVVWHFQKKHIDFHATEPPSPQAAVEHKIQVSKRNNQASAPPDLKRITTTELSPITLPDVPVPTDTDEPSQSEMSGIGVEGFGSGVGSGGNGGGNGGGMTLYGAPGGAGLIGNLYDLKQTMDGQPTDMAENEVESGGREDSTDPNYQNSPQTKAQIAFLSHFVTDWNMGDLDTYYKSDQSLSLAQLAIPEHPSNEATVDFHVADKVRARRWIAVYSAKILPPEAGTYRFIGFGDDFLVVNIDGKNVLDASYPIERVDPSADTSENVGQAWAGQSLVCGQWFQMQAGIASTIQILIGEGPGGASGFVLMIQPQGDGSSPGDYPIFQVGDMDVPEMNIPNFTRKKLLFQLSD